MARGSSGSTFYLVGLIFAILVSMGLLLVCYKLNQDVTAKESEITTYKRKYESELGRVKSLTQEVKGIRELVTGRNQSFEKDHYETTILAQANTRLQEILSEEWIATEDWKNIQDVQIKQIWEKMTQYRGETQRFTNLGELYQELLDQLRAVIHIIPRLRYERIRSREEVDQIRADMERLRSDKQREIEDLRARLTQADDQALETARRLDQAKKTWQDEKESILQEVTRLNRDHALQSARLESEKAQLQGKIKDLTKKKTRSFAEFSKPDGGVVYADPALGYAWINLGSKDGLRRNLRFQVYQSVKGGRQRIKGVIEVRKVEEDMAQCAVLEAQEVRDPITGELLVVPDANDPVVKGDLIRNPFFDAEEQKVFVFLGKKLTNRYYNLPEIGRKIEEFGGKVEREVSTETDFVVLLGEGEEGFQEQYERATQFGVTFMREEELLEYLGRQ